MTPAPQTEPAPRTPTSARKVASASFIGTTVEYYDFFIYGTAAALVFPKLFFPESSPLVGTLLSFATFGVGFLARPVGGIVFGHFGDRIGRKRMLVVSLVTMGTATMLMGLMPTYATIGLAAPVLLTLLRLVQGFAVGGEWGGATLMAVEHAPQGKRGFYGAFPQMGAPAGTGLATIAFFFATQLSPDRFESWGWRLPFLAAFPLLLVAVYIRRKVEESPLFEELLKQDERAKIPAVDVFRTAWRRLLVAITSALLGVGGFYIMTTFVISYGADTLGLSRSLMVNATLVAAVFQIAVILFMGRVAERIGPGRVTLWGGAATALLAFPLFWLIDTKSPLLVVFAVALGIAVLSVAYAVSGALLTELFPAHLRYSGVALAYNLAGALTGFLPFVATALLDTSGGASWPVSLLLAALALLTALGGFLGERMRVKDNVTTTA